MAMYESDHTKFMREFLQQHPEELEEQKKGRALWWDKPPVDLNTQQKLRESSVPNKAYYYQSEV